MAKDEVSWCPECGGRISHQLIHCGFDDTAYAYCDRCGAIASPFEWSNAAGVGVSMTLHARISRQIESYLKPCDCSGRFHCTTSPRCPHCNRPLVLVGAWALARFRLAIDEIIPFLQPPELMSVNDARGFLVVLGGIPEKLHQVERLKALARGVKTQSMEWVHRESPSKLSERAGELYQATEAVLAAF